MSRKKRKAKASAKRAAWLKRQAKRSRYAAKLVAQGRNPSTGEPLEAPRKVTAYQPEQVSISFTSAEGRHESEDGESDGG